MVELSFTICKVFKVSGSIPSHAFLGPKKKEKKKKKRVIFAICTCLVGLYEPFGPKK